MTHDEVIEEVVRKAIKAGLLIHYCRAGLQCIGSKGLPDLIIVGPEGILLREVKSQYDDTSADQDWWGYMLTKVDNRCLIHGQPPLYAVWRFPDLQGIIVRELAAIGGHF